MTKVCVNDIEFDNKSTRHLFTLCENNVTLEK